MQSKLDRPGRDVEIKRLEKYANERDSLSLRAAALRQRTLDFHREFRVSGSERKDELRSVWDATRRNVDEGASIFLNEPEIYCLTQDLINKCGIAVPDIENSDPNTPLLEKLTK